MAQHRFVKTYTMYK